MSRKWSDRSDAHRTLKATADPQQGADVQALQCAYNMRAKSRGMKHIEADGIFGADTMRAVLAMGYQLGALDSTLAKGEVTIGLQEMVRAPENRTEAQKARAKARRRGNGSVCYPVAHLISDKWGYHPPVHDGVDLICPPNEPLLAICDGEIIRADASGWWGKGAQASAGHPVSDGDGIIVLRCTGSVGPFKAGLNFCYGHAEHATVRAGQKVKAGDLVGHAGFANAWHTHWMVNGRDDDRGLGDRDPAPYLRYAKENG